MDILTYVQPLCNSRNAFPLSQYPANVTAFPTFPSERRVAALGGGAAMWSATLFPDRRNGQKMIKNLPTQNHGMIKRIEKYTIKTHL